MFWKKNKKEHKSNDYFEWEADKRSTYRAEPTSEEPIYFHIEDESLLVHDISAGGASFDRPTKLKAGQEVIVRFRLPYINKGARASFTIIRIDDTLAYGAFKGLSAKGEELIHQYILELQKTEARRRRERPADEGL